MGIGSVTWEPDDFDFDQELGLPPSQGDKMHIPKAVCMNLTEHPDKMGREMAPKKNDFTLEMITKATQVDGFEVDHSYYKIRADLYKCPECGAEAMVGFAPRVLAEHWQGGYNSVRSDAKAKFRP